MKSNKLYIIGAVSFLIGIITILISFCLVQFDFKKLGFQPEYQEKNYIAEASVSEIIIDDYDMEVVIQESRDQNIGITYYENGKNYYHIEQQGQTLSVQRKNNMKWHDYIFNGNFQDISLVVLLPSNYNGALTVKTTNGKIDAKKINVKNLTLLTSNNRIKVELAEISGSAEFTTSNGPVELQNVHAKEDIICKSSNQKIILDSVTGNGIRIETSNGKITLCETEAKDWIRSKTSNGAIHVERVSFENELNLTTSNGRIYGTLAESLADCTIRSKTSNGKNNLPENLNGGARMVSIQTSNNHIEVAFNP